MNTSSTALADSCPEYLYWATKQDFNQLNEIKDAFTAKLIQFLFYASSKTTVSSDTNESTQLARFMKRASKKLENCAGRDRKLWKAVSGM